VVEVAVETVQLVDTLEVEVELEVLDHLFALQLLQPL
jgi:hypothetical protein